MVLTVTDGAINVGFWAVVELSEIPDGAVHKYVSVFPSGSEEAEPSKVTILNSFTD